MHSINIHFISFIGRKFLLKAVGLLTLALVAFFYELEASSLTVKSDEQHNYQMQFVQTWLYNYCEKPNSTEIEMMVSKLMNEINKFQRKKERYRSEEAWLENIFYQIHRKFLKRYEKFSTVPDLFEQGVYDCVSGTALYALVCQLLNIPYAIRETEYHVYLLALVDGKKVLIESTDPLYGFVSQPTIVQSLVKAYHEDNSSKHKLLSANNNRVDWVQLAGLQYFNKAVKFYNEKHFSDAVSYLNKAMQYYKSSRIALFKKRIMQITASYPEYMKST